MLDVKKTKWYYTPVSSYADMTQLEKLPPVKLVASGTVTRRGGVETAHLTMSNPSSSLAFFIRLQVKQGSAEVLPVMWQDNYFSLMPGEKREITATYKTKDLAGPAAVIAVEGWNISPVRIPLANKTGSPQLRDPKRR